MKIRDESMAIFILNIIACLWGDFVCRSNSKCVPKITRCDGVMDCDDNSDELNCRKND